MPYFLMYYWTMTADVAFTALIGLFAAALGYIFNEIRHQREIRVKMIEVAVGILAAEPDKTKGLRNWAADTLAHYSKDVRLTDEAKAALRDRPLPTYADAVFSSAGRGHIRGVGTSGEPSETPLPLRSDEGSSA
jgi:hypothetical protein